jgi:hypothetical protein
MKHYRTTGAAAAAAAAATSTATGATISTTGRTTHPNKCQWKS